MVHIEYWDRVNAQGPQRKSELGPTAWGLTFLRFRGCPNVARVGTMRWSTRHTGYSQRGPNREMQFSSKAHVCTVWWQGSKVMADLGQLLERAFGQFLRAWLGIYPGDIEAYYRRLVGGRMVRLRKSTVPPFIVRVILSLRRPYICRSGAWEPGLLWPHAVDCVTGICCTPKFRGRMLQLQPSICSLTDVSIAVYHFPVKPTAVRQCSAYACGVRTVFDLAYHGRGPCGLRTTPWSPTTRTTSGL